MNTAILILCHRTPHYWIQQARQNPNCEFYIHYDLRSNIQDLNQAAQLENVTLLPTRRLIHWAGFSMVQATLALINEALKNKKNKYFHLVSGNCVALHPLTELDQQCQKLPENSLFLSFEHQARLRYRLRFNTPHADTTWQRSLIGKVLTKLYQLADRLTPSTQAPITGSQWFSAHRLALEWIQTQSDAHIQNFFAHKLCPDEHFFQYLISHRPNPPQHDHNRRFIQFSGTQNHPQWLAIPELLSLSCHPEFWFARKVHDHDALQFLEQIH